MEHLLVVLVPLGLAAAVSPVMLTEQTVLLAGPGGRRTGLSYAAGTAVVLVVLVGAVLLLGRSVALPEAPRLDAGLDLAIGVLLLALAAVVARWRPRREHTSRRTESSMGPPAAFGFGSLSMATNFTTLALVVPAAKQIASDGLPAWESLLAAALLVVLVCLPAWGPVALGAVAPSATQKLLDGLHAFIHRYGRKLVAGLLVAAGVFLVARGVLQMVT